VRRLQICFQREAKMLLNKMLAELEVLCIRAGYPCFVAIHENATLLYNGQYGTSLHCWIPTKGYACPLQEDVGRYGHFTNPKFKSENRLIRAASYRRGGSAEATLFPVAVPVSQHQ
jgi:hypothetical protein